MVSARTGGFSIQQNQYVRVTGEERVQLEQKNTDPTNSLHQSRSEPLIFVVCVFFAFNRFPLNRRPGHPLSLRTIGPIDPFRTAVAFWGQITWNLSNLSPKRDCGSKIIPGRRYTLCRHKLPHRGARGTSQCSSR